jgi:tetratricopeptide (TPR) repeat protein
MNKNIYLIAALFLIAGCSSNSRNIPTDTTHYDPNALYYYSLAETALQMKDINSAAQLLRESASYSPKDLFIKKRLLEVLSLQAKFKPEIHQEIIALGEDCAARKNCPVKILIILAESYSYSGNIEKGEEYLKKALDKEPSMQLYLSYYLFRKGQLGDDDHSLLEKALEQEWKDQNAVMMIAEIYNKTDPDSALSILNKAYDRWSEERFLIPILGIYERRGETQQIINRIQQHLDADNAASEFLIEHLLDLYFKTRNFQGIVDNQAYCLEIARDPALRYLFFAALSLGKNDLAIETAQLIEEKKDLPENVVPLFHTYYGYVLFIEKYYEKAAENFLLSGDINLVLDIITELGLVRVVTDKDLLLFSEAVLRQTDQIDMAHFLCGYLYALLDDSTKGEDYLSRVSFEYLQENGLVESAAVLLISLDESNLDQAQELLSQREIQIPSFNEIAGFYFYNTQQDSVAYNYFRAEVDDNPSPSTRLITAAVILGENYRDIDFIKKALEISLQLYGDDPEIMNLFGYTIADLSIQEEFERALVLLNNAINLEPDNTMYWDSLAWLYFRMEKYEKALAAMDKPLQTEIDNSEIAYHLGEIYLKISQTDKAKRYLKLAVELDNHSDSVNLSRKLLQELNNIEEK